MVDERELEEVKESLLDDILQNFEGYQQMMKSDWFKNYDPKQELLNFLAKRDILEVLEDCMFFVGQYEQDDNRVTSSHAYEVREKINKLVSEIEEGKISVYFTSKDD